MCQRNFLNYIKFFDPDRLDLLSSELNYSYVNNNVLSSMKNSSNRIFSFTIEEIMFVHFCMSFDS